MLEMTTLTNLLIYNTAVERSPAEIWLAMLDMLIDHYCTTRIFDQAYEYQTAAIHTSQDLQRAPGSFDMHPRNSTVVLK